MAVVHSWDGTRRLASPTTVSLGDLLLSTLKAQKAQRHLVMLMPYVQIKFYFLGDCGSQYSPDWPRRLDSIALQRLTAQSSFARLGVISAAYVALYGSSCSS